VAAGTDRAACLLISRTAVVLLLLLAFRARADVPPMDAVFDQALAAQVFTAAFTFMGPRTLEPVSVPQLTSWGLRGITALDPDLAPVMHDADVTLLQNAGQGPARVVTVVPLPAAGDVTAWGLLGAQIFGAAWQNSAALRRAGTQGVVASFFDEVFNHLDPYSRYVPPDAAGVDRAHRSGTAGIGVMLAGRAGGLVIGSVVADGPAAMAGIVKGERLVAIDGVTLGRADAAVALGRLNGEEGSNVAVTLRGRGGSRVVTMQRVLVPADTVVVTRSGDVLLLGVSGFTASTATRLRHELERALARRPQPRGVVFDLRGNRGGVLQQAVEVANLVLTGGPIATTVGRDPQADHAWVADGDDIADGLPIVVLVDGRSASAAEVLAAALEDDGRAVVVGSATLGKGLVQTVGAMPDGGELFVTWSRVLAPAGWPLQGLGVMPQVCTSLGQEETRRQLDALSMGQQTMREVLATHRAARPNVPLAEILTIRNACPAALGRDADLDAARWLIGNPVAYATALAPM
jgi:carboxyl-terminal processing protease